MPIDAQALPSAPHAAPTSPQAAARIRCRCSTTAVCAASCDARSACKPGKWVAGRKGSSSGARAAWVPFGGAAAGTGCWGLTACWTAGLTAGRSSMPSLPETTQYTQATCLGGLQQWQGAWRVRKRSLLFGRALVALARFKAAQRMAARARPCESGSPRGKLFVWVQLLGGAHMQEHKHVSGRRRCNARLPHQWLLHLLAIGWSPATATSSMPPDTVTSILESAGGRRRPRGGAPGQQRRGHPPASLGIYTPSSAQQHGSGTCPTEMSESIHPSKFLPGTLRPGCGSGACRVDQQRC